MSKFILITIIITTIITAAILWMLHRQRKRKLPPLVLRILLWVRSTIRHTARCVKQRALRSLYSERLARELVSMASERKPVKLSDLESISSNGVTITPEEEEEKELLVLMN